MLHTPADVGGHRLWTNLPHFPADYLLYWDNSTHADAAHQQVWAGTASGRIFRIFLRAAATGDESPHNAATHTHTPRLCVSSKLGTTSVVNSVHFVFSCARYCLCRRRPLAPHCCYTHTHTHTHTAASSWLVLSLLALLVLE
jgi:hypothetical protein